MVDYPRFLATSRASLRRWLARNHASARGVWIVRYKKDSGRARLAYNDIVEELLCFGWIDSRPAALDELRSMLLATPRKPKSRWSKLNKERIARLEARGLLAPSGLQAIATAQQNGTWTGLDAVERLDIPRDLAAALSAHRQAREKFDAFPRGERRRILEWITSAKRPETRARRVAETARLAAKNQRANAWRAPGRRR